MTGTAGDYTAVIATFKRPESLERVVLGLTSQSTPPSLIVVVDNDPAQSADPVVRRLASTGAPILAVQPGSNLGPAGGWAHGADIARLDDRRGEFLAVFDDDDAIERTEIMANLLHTLSTADATVAAVGLRGARCDRRTARLRRSRSDDFGSVDYLASGGAPLYRWTTIEDHGFFDRSLFFGFEDLELGLRLRAAGFVLLTIDTDHVVSDSSPVRTSWREYFKTRAIIVVCRRHLGLTALVVTIARSVIGGALLLLLRDRRPELAVARWRGAADGFRGRLGQRGWAPRDNPSKT